MSGLRSEARILFSGVLALAASPEENRKVITDYYAAYATGDAADTFFWQTYPLKPPPERLAD